LDLIFLSHRIPFPPNKGDKIRSNAIFSHLAKSYRVHLACFVDEPADFAHTDRIRRLAGGECLFLPLMSVAKLLSVPRALITREPVTTAYFGNPEIARWIDRVATTYPIAAIVAFSSAMAPYVLDRTTLKPSRGVLDLVDLDSDKWRQYAGRSRGLRRWLYQREATALFRLERRAACCFGRTVLVSRYEADSFIAAAPETASRVRVLTNGVDHSYYSPGRFPNPYPEEEIAVAMTGRMDYEPNIDATKWFLAEIMPRLRRMRPKVRFYAVGANPPRAVRALAGPAFTVTGFVDDVRPYLQHAAAIVAPLRIARGVQNKVLEAMAMARPVVATSAATRALEVVSGVHLWVGDTPDSFANSVVAAIDGDEREAVRRRAREFVKTHHNWTDALATLDSVLTQVSGSGAEGPSPVPGMQSAIPGRHHPVAGALQ
jgi:sugar transferase (PEP-CTERM/EpsH1 system associated)